MRVSVGLVIVPEKESAGAFLFRELELSDMTCHIDLFIGGLTDEFSVSFVCH